MSQFCIQISVQVQRLQLHQESNLKILLEQENKADAKTIENSAISVSTMALISSTTASQKWLREQSHIEWPLSYIVGKSDNYRPKVEGYPLKIECNWNRQRVHNTASYLERKERGQK